MLTAFILFVLAVLFCQGSVLLLSDQRYAAQAAAAIGVACVLFVCSFGLYEFAFESEELLQAYPHRKAASVLLRLWTATVPTVVLSVLAFGFSRLRRALWGHLGVLFASAAVVYVYPLFLLISVCASGLDCI